MPIYVVFAKKKRLLLNPPTANYGWVVEYEENSESVELESVVIPKRVAIPKAKPQTNRTKVISPTAGRNEEMWDIPTKNPVLEPTLNNEYF